jgi:cytochrome c556
MKSLCPLVAATLVLTAGGAQAGSEVEKAVDYRQGLMNVFAWNVTSMGDMAKGKVPFDAAAFSGYGKDLAAAASLELLAAFPEDSINEDSDASDTIWLDWETFQKKHEALSEQSAKLAEVVAGGDEAAMKEQFRETAKTCKSCHDDFKN